MITPIQRRVVVTAAGTPVPLSSTTLAVESVEIHAMKSLTVANAGNVYIGFKGDGPGNLRVLTPGQSWSIAPRVGSVDLAKIYVDAANSADAIVFSAIKS